MENDVQNVHKQMQKQLAKQKRERRFHRWLTSLSWSLPIVAFGSFFTVWHQISAALNTPTTQTSKSEAASRPSSPTTNDPVLLQIGSNGTQVSTIQEQLSQLGYFNHVITQYYGRVTADAVRLFQADHGLPATGNVDNRTLQALQSTIRQSNANNLSQGSSIDSTGPGSTSQSSSSAVALSQQSNPVTVSSGS